MANRPGKSPPEGGGDHGTLVVEHRFAVVPEWLLDTPISDSAFRLYVILLRYGNTSGQRMPGRATLARRLRKSTDTVDRALRELQQHGAVTVERRRDGNRNLTNRYQLRTTPPGSPAPTPRPTRRVATSSAAGRTAAASRLSRACPYNGPRLRAGSRTRAATPPPQAGTARARPTELTSRNISPAPAAGVGGSRSRAAAPGRSPAATRARPGRTRAARVAAPSRPDPEPPTEKEPPPTPSTASTGHDRQRLLAASGLSPDGLQQLTSDCQQARRDLGKPTTRWTTARLLDALTEAVHAKQWPAQHAVAALRTIAADPATASPMRLGCPGPWWDQLTPDAGTPGSSSRDPAELAALEAVLAEADGHRITIQREARKQLHAEGRPLTRLAVARRACQLLQTRQVPA